MDLEQKVERSKLRRPACIVVHATKNLGVIAVKHILGFVGGWW